MAESIIKKNDVVEDIKSEITTYNGVTIDLAKKYGNIVQITGTLPASMATGKQSFSLPNKYSPISGLTVAATRAEVTGGVVALSSNGTAMYYIQTSVYPSTSVFNFVYLTAS